LRATSGTRPTADLIKGSIFSMLEALAYKRGFEPDEDGNLAAALAWPRVLDLFAGSGALGIEALSRGAQHATFVESDRDAVRIIEANLRATNLQDQAQVHVGVAKLVLPRLRGPIDALFADPPYQDTAALVQTLERLDTTDLLLETSVAVLEQPAEHEPPSRVGQLPLATTRRRGRTRISLYAG
jgi:16S rRNA (guanine966-N2)-methyltransferase